MTGSDMIRFESVSINYGATGLFSNLSFTIQAGTKVALTGPSGSGKTSALELIPGFRTPTGGQVLVDDMAVTAATRQAVRSRLAYLPQETPLTGTVGEALGDLFRLRANAGRRPPVEAIDELIARLLLPADTRDRNFSHLSGGEKRRVGLVAVLLLDRPLLLLDEPTAGLDEDAARAVIDLVFNLPATVVSIAHDPAWHASCDALIDVKNGPANQNASAHSNAADYPDASSVTDAPEQHR